MESLTLEQAYHIGELIAAIAVVISLVYLGLQVRHNTNQSEAAMASNMMNEQNRMMEVMISNPQVPELWAKLGTAVELNATEDALLEIIVRRYLVHWLEIQTGFDHKLLEENVYEAFCQDVKRIVREYPVMHAKLKEVMDEYPTIRDVQIMMPLYI